MKDIPLEEVPAVLASFGETVTFVMNHGKQVIDTVDEDDDFFDSNIPENELNTYPGTEVPYALELYWESIGKDVKKELPKLFKTRVLEDGSIEVSYKWWPSHFDMEKWDFDDSLLPNYMTWDELQKHQLSGNLRSLFAQTDAHDIIFYTRPAGRPIKNRYGEGLGFFDDFTEFWTVCRGKKYITSVLIHED